MSMHWAMKANLHRMRSDHLVQTAKNGIPYKTIINYILEVYSSPYTATKYDLKTSKYRVPSSIDCRKRRSHARYPTQDTFAWEQQR